VPSGSVTVVVLVPSTVVPLNWYTVPVEFANGFPSDPDAVNVQTPLIDGITTNQSLSPAVSRVPVTGWATFGQMQYKPGIEPQSSLACVTITYRYSTGTVPTVEKSTTATRAYLFGLPCAVNVTAPLLTPVAESTVIHDGRLVTCHRAFDVTPIDMDVCDAPGLQVGDATANVGAAGGLAEIPSSAA